MSISPLTGVYVFARTITKSPLRTPGQVLSVTPCISPAVTLRGGNPLKMLMRGCTVYFSLSSVYTKYARYSISFVTGVSGRSSSVGVERASRHRSLNAAPELVALPSSTMYSSSVTGEGAITAKLSPVRPDRAVALGVAVGGDITSRSLSTSTTSGLLAVSPGPGIA